MVDSLLYENPAATALTARLSLNSKSLHCSVNEEVLTSYGQVVKHV